LAVVRFEFSSLSVNLTKMWETVRMPKKKASKPKKSAKKKPTREDVNQVAARIVRDATENK